MLPNVADVRNMCCTSMPSSPNLHQKQYCIASTGAGQQELQRNAAEMGHSCCHASTRGVELGDAELAKS